MSTSWYIRYAPLAGVLFAVLFIVAAVMSSTFDYLPAPEKIQSYYETNHSRIQVAVFLLGIGALCLAIYTAAVWSAMKTAGMHATHSMTALVGGIAAAALLLVYEALVSGAAGRAGTDAGITPAGATVLSDVGGTLLGVAVPAAMSVHVIGVSLALFRRDRVPAWLPWLGVLVTVGLLSPINYVFLVVGLIWIAGTGAVIYLRSQAVSVPASE